MKQNLLIFSLMIFGSLSAQVTINRNHLVVSGQKVVQATDTNTNALAASGTNMTWDYSAITSDFIDSMHFGLPFWFKGYTNFPDANLAFMSYNDSQSVNFMKIDNSAISVVGFYNFTDSSENVFQNKSKILNFPSTYASTFNETNSFIAASFPLGFDPDSTGPAPYIDSMRVKITRTNKSNVDGWGNIKTPLGTFAVIKQTSLEINVQTFEMKTSGFWLAIPQFVLNQLGFPPSTPDSSYNVNFWTDDASVGFPLVSYNYSPGMSNTQNLTWLMTKPKASSVQTVSSEQLQVYPNPVHDILYINTTAENTLVQLFNAEGKLVLSETITNSNSIFIADFQNGLYCITLSNASSGEVMHTAKLLKQ